ncbi:MerR family transcriptional regulator [Aestuariicoccus sp. MJ-SS9]|uniref:MerR family transcriptional regulator n=1 Tax=Aestuariicoccus sp. MJ-SS9 TaxID=3079855 RepID=UPI0029063E20|nr:MerR family transcriptional regulator [Aestuariicoccus sp. MJ-SS9]MDU8912664.1 MerR family transcriptional regulator [Aestuariicoccus sp. MJ-SS9]
MSKSRDAFRTISEVAEWLDTPAHVLRFWESKFSQVKPVKRAGGRRYYRPADMALLGGIKQLLHDEGMTIKGAQKTLREQGVKYVSSLSQPIDGEPVEPAGQIEDAPFAQAVEPEDTVVPFPANEEPAPEPDLFAALAEPASDQIATPLADPAEPETAEAVEGATAEPAVPPDTPDATADAEEAEAQGIDTLPAFLQEPMAEVAPPETDNPPEPEPEPEEGAAEEDAVTLASEPDPTEVAAEPEPAELPPEPESAGSAAESEPTEAAAAPEPVVIPPKPDLDAIRPGPGALTHLARIDALRPMQAAELAPLARALRDHLDVMTAPRG